MDIASSSGGSGAGAFLVTFVIAYVIAILPVWIVFTKAGKPGWGALIPIYNYYVMLKVVGRPGWWLILFFIPFVNIVVGIIVANDLSKSFGHGVGFTIGLVLLSWIFLMILAFGSSRYLGPAAEGQLAAPATP